jgi:hypothetical protein
MRDFRPLNRRYLWLLEWLAGAEGIEPPNAGIKIRHSDRNRTGAISPRFAIGLEISFKKIGSFYQGSISSQRKRWNFADLPEKRLDREFAVRISVRFCCMTCDGIQNVRRETMLPTQGLDPVTPRMARRKPRIL